MSMSQEEIEALMNGAGDFSEDEPQEDNTVSEEPAQDDAGDENIDDILAGIDGVTDDGTGEDNFDDILAGIDGVTDDGTEEENFDDILAGIDGVTDDPSSSGAASSTDSDSSQNNIEEMIDQNKYPLPVEKEHKVVNQLSEVAEDSEEKASQIFDVLSFVLDENSETQNFNKGVNEFLTKQQELLASLSTKFPNISVFKENLDAAQQLNDSLNDMNTRIENENMKIFEAMELMQYHDINRQKIERVMSVIKKLNDYLNGIFEDDSSKPEVQIAKHISGDSHETVGADDLESLISEFSQG